MNVEVVIADYLNKTHGKEIAYLLNAYATDPMGGGISLDKTILDNVAIELSRLPNAFSVIGYIDKQPAGLVNCFEGFSTFSCKPLVNIHDMVVLKRYRHNGLSHTMLKRVEEIALQKGCCKLTLEVLTGNAAAKSSYTKFGFSGYELDPEVGVAQFWQKQL